VEENESSPLRERTQMSRGEVEELPGISIKYAGGCEDGGKARGVNGQIVWRTYRVTQVLTGHGFFQAYLYEIGKVAYLWVFSCGD